MSVPSASLRAFLAGLIDYAGLFPPAQLPLSEAIELYGRYRATPDRWMLSRFIIPAAQLHNLTESGRLLFSADSPFLFSVLGRGGQTADEFCTNLDNDLADITRFRQENEGRVVADVFEVRLPTADLIPETADLLHQHGLRGFFELSAVSSQQLAVSSQLSAVSCQLSAVGFQQSAVSGGAGLKVRMGGVVASAFPPVAQVAEVLLFCRDAGVPFKATAGLHHPVRHWNKAVQTHMHGFVNLFGAGILAHVHNLDLATVGAILSEETAAAFQFDEDTFSWRGLAAKTAEILPIRQQFLLSYGSCSFDEPREDLRAFGWLQ